MSRALAQAKHPGYKKTASGLCADGMPSDAVKQAVKEFQNPSKTASRTTTKEQTR